MSVLEEFEAPFKDKTICCSAYEIINLLMKHGVTKGKAISTIDILVNHHQVVLRPVNIPQLKFRQIHKRKTKNHPDVHVQMPRLDYKIFKVIQKKLDSIPLFTITKNRDDNASKIGMFNKLARVRDEATRCYKRSLSSLVKTSDCQSENSGSNPDDRTKRCEG